MRKLVAIFMKGVILISVILLSSCKQMHDKEVVVIHKNVEKTKIELPASKLERLKYHTRKDTVYIFSQARDTLKFSREEFNDIIDNFPELYSMNTADPDSTYSISKIWVDLVDSSGNKNHISFNSEVGQDVYYILYAYFLKQKNGIVKYSIRRKNLLVIYRTLNSLFGALNYGGTYYGHQYSRIEGYAEFSIFWFRHYEDYFDRPYDISKQKEFYIAGLKQLIIDEVKIDNNQIREREKDERRKELFGLVDNLNKEITDNFYLRMAQSFQSEHY